MLAVNLKSAFLITQAVFQGMRELRWGRIINISSVAAQTGGITAPPYVASKAWLWGLALLCRSVDKGWHYGQYCCSSVDRNRYGPGTRGKTRPHSRS
jgi:NAD(P)-dependent dehydrogenase (short-subunit alcohol dehydrogenase family)